MSDLDHTFTIIGLTETKIMNDKPLVTNITMHGHQFLSQPTHSNAGDIRLYINDGLRFY